MSIPLEGLRTVIYPAPDLDEAKRWWTDLLGIAPSVDQPFYVGFNVGGFELGLIPDGRPGALGAQAYWGVPDIEAELARLLALGASPRAGRAWIRAARVLASLRERAYITPDDIKELAYPILRHRLIRKAETEIEGTTVEQVIDQLLASVEVPR